MVLSKYISPCAGLDGADTRGVRWTIWLAFIVVAVTVSEDMALPVIELTQSSLNLNSDDPSAVYALAVGKKRLTLLNLISFPSPNVILKGRP